jgi:16S rRNA (guanine966-N2)-methyltransferase
VRILAGRWKGRVLHVPPGARPTSGRARAALFDLLGGRVAGARVLELYAGSGAVGLEAVSRGARSAVLVEPDGTAIARSLERLSPEPGEVILMSARAETAIRSLARRSERFDVVFADPPYGRSLDQGELSAMAGLLAPGGVLALQEDAARESPTVAELVLLERRAYGRNVFLFFAMH